ETQAETDVTTVTAAGEDDELLLADLNFDDLLAAEMDIAAPLAAEEIALATPADSESEFDDSVSAAAGGIEFADVEADVGSEVAESEFAPVVETAPTPRAPETVVLEAGDDANAAMLADVDPDVVEVFLEEAGDLMEELEELI